MRLIAFINMHYIGWFDVYEFFPGFGIRELIIYVYTAIDNMYILSANQVICPSIRPTAYMC